MSDSNQIAFSLSGKVRGEAITPSSISFARFNRFNQQVEAFVTGNSKELLNDEIKLKIEEGSYRILLWLPLTLLQSLNVDIDALTNDSGLQSLDSRRAKILNEWQVEAETNPEMAISITPSWQSDPATIRIDKNSSYKNQQDDTLWFETEKYIKGEILEAGGSTRTNLHLKVEEQSKALTVGASKESLKGQSLGTLYEEHIIRIKAEENYQTGALRNLEFIEFVDYQPEYDEDELHQLIQQASPKWSDIKDANAWLKQIRNDNDTDDL